MPNQHCFPLYSYPSSICCQSHRSRPTSTTFNCGQV